MFETYIHSITVLFDSLSTQPKTRSALAKVTASLTQSVDFIRSIIDDTGLNVAPQKRNQRQLRYEKLREEFILLISSLSKEEADRTKLKKVEAELASERADSKQKLLMYKD
jgi:hypothetical protein